MAVFRLPVASTDPHSRLSVDLDGRPFVITLDWNDREGAWYFSMHADDAEQTPIVQGWPVRVAAQPLWRNRHALRPPGDILFIDLGRGNLDPGRDDLGTRVIALYYDAESVGEL